MKIKKRVHKTRPTMYQVSNEKIKFMAECMENEILDNLPRGKTIAKTIISQLKDIINHQILLGVYKYKQEQWILKNNVRVGDKVRIICEPDFDWFPQYYHFNTKDMYDDWFPQYYHFNTFVWKVKY